MQLGLLTISFSILILLSIMLNFIYSFFKYYSDIITPNYGEKYQ